VPKTDSSNPYSPPALTTEHATINDAASLSDFARRKRKKLHQMLIAMAVLGFATRGLEGFAATAKAFAFFVLMTVVIAITSIIGLFVDRI